MPADVDAIVIGAGMTGAGVAAELASDRRVVLIEQEERPGTHATGRSASVHSETYGSPCVRLLSRASRDHFTAGADGRSFATDRGCLYLATPEQVERLESFGGQPTVAPAVERLGEDELRALLPLIRPGAIVAALFEHGARSLDVDAIHADFLKRFRRSSGELHCSAPATAIRHDGGRWLVDAGGQSFSTPLLINAAGAWGVAVAAMAGVRPIGLQPMRRTVALVDPPTGSDPARWPMAVDIDEQFYVPAHAGTGLIDSVPPMREPSMQVTGSHPIAPFC